MLGFKRPVRSLFSLAFTVIVGNIGSILPTFAAIVNGGFEDPLTLGWQISGDVTNNIGILNNGPTQGASQAVLSNAANSGLDDATNLNFSGNNVTNINSLESFLGLSLGSLNPLN